MGCNHSYLSAWSVWEETFPITNEYYGAGCLWMSDTHILAGIHTRQSRSHKPKKISGFGGKAKKGEVWWQTAFRETVEEIFDIHEVPTDLIYALRNHIIPITILHQESPSYLTLVFSFRQMKRFLQICKRYLQSSPLYTQFPNTIHDLVFQRQMSQSEISHIVFWPRFFRGTQFRFTSDLLHDLDQSKKLVS